MSKSKNKRKKDKERPSSSLKREIKKRDNYKCRKCGRSDNLTVHHINPVRNKGGNDPSNLITICLPCHIEYNALEMRSTYDFYDWLDKPPLSMILYFLDNMLIHDIKDYVNVQLYSNHNLFKNGMYDKMPFERKEMDI